MSASFPPHPEGYSEPVLPVMSLPALNIRQCRICGRPAAVTSTHTISNGYPLFACDYCETVMIEERPSAKVLNEAYDHLFQNGAYEAHRAEFNLLRAGRRPPNLYRSLSLNQLRRMVKGRRLVEIGGGTGSFGMLAQSKGWLYTDYDISEAAIGFANQLSLDARRFPVGEAPPIPANSVDVIVMWEVIEHVWNLREYLDAIFEGLNEGGVFLFSTPNYLRPAYQRAIVAGRPAGSIPPVHINFFTPASLNKVMKAVGFQRFKVTKRRIYKPRANWRETVDGVKLAIGFGEPMTLIGFARKN